MTSVGSFTSTNFWWSKPVSVGPTSYTTVVDFEVRDVNGDGYTEIRLADSAGTNNSFAAFYFHGGVAFQEVWAPTGTAQWDLSPKPVDGTGNSLYTLFANTTTTGITTFSLYNGAGVVNQSLAGKGNSYLNGNAGMLGVAVTSPLATLHVENARGTTTSEIARFTDVAASTSLGMSIGYSSAGATTAYLYNRYAGGAASALKFGFGNTFGSGVVLTATQAGNVAIGSAAVATNATDGFLYVDSCAGTPTGTPTAFTGRVPLVYDTTNNKFYIYNGAWKGVTLA